MNIKTGKFLAIIFLLIPIAAFAENGPRIYEQGGNFSFCPPLNWQAAEWPGLKYKIVFGPVDEDFAANINVVDETYNGNLRDYVDLNLDQLGIYFPDYKLLARDTFKTISGISGEKIIYNITQQGFFIRAICYYFPAPDNRYFVVTCSTADTAAEKNAPLFDRGMETFEYSK